MVSLRIIVATFAAAAAAAGTTTVISKDAKHGTRPPIPSSTDRVIKQPPANPVPVPFRELDGIPVEVKDNPYLIPELPKLPHYFLLQIIKHGLECLSKTQEWMYNIVPKECSKFNESRPYYETMVKEFVDPYYHIRKDEFLNGTSKLTYASKRTENCHRLRNTDLSVGAFEIIATNIVGNATSWCLANNQLLNGALDAATEYSGMPGFLEGLPQKLLQQLLDTSDINVVNRNWTVNWKGVII